MNQQPRRVIVKMVGYRFKFVSVGDVMQYLKLFGNVSVLLTDALQTADFSTYPSAFN